MYNIEHVLILLSNYNNIAQVKYFQTTDMKHNITIKFVDLTAKHLKAYTCKELYTLAEQTLTNHK